MAAPNYAQFKINGTAASQKKFEATSGQSLTFELETPTPVLSVTYAVYDASDPKSPLATLDAPPFVFSNALPSITKSPASTAEIASTPATTGGAAWIVRATATLPNGQSHRFERKVIVRGGQYGLVIPGETTQGGPRGWADEIRQLAAAMFAQPLSPVSAATTAALPANTRTVNTLQANANGALASQDGVAPFVGMRLLVWQEATAANNGVYRVTQVGTGGTPWIMVRDVDADASSEFASGQLRHVAAGTVYGGKLFVLSVSGSFVLNTDPVTYTPYSLSGVYDIRAYGGIGNGTANDTTALVNVTTAAKNAGGGVVYLGAGTFATDNFTLSAASGVRIVGAGQGVTIIKARQTGAIVTFSACTNCGFEDVAIERKDALFQTAGGFSLTFFGCLNCWTSDIRISYCTAGVRVERSISTHFRGKTSVDHVRGGGGAGAFAYLGEFGVGPSNGCKVDWLDVGGISYNNATHIVRGSRNNSTAYALGDIIFINDRYWECTFAGTSAVGAPGGFSSYPGTDGPTAYTTTVTDGTAVFRFLIANSFAVLQDFLGDNLEISRYDSVGPCAHAVLVARSNVSAAVPSGLQILSGRIEGTISNAINLDRGTRVSINANVDRVWGGRGVSVGSNFGGGVEIRGKIRLCSQNGVVCDSGDVLIDGVDLRDCSQDGSNLHAGILIQAVSNVRVIGTRSSGSLQASGIALASGATNCVVEGCDVTGNVPVSGLVDGSGSPTNRIRDNVGDFVKGYIRLTGQNASLGTTNLFVGSNPRPGLYRVDVYGHVTTAGTGGTMDTTISYTDDLGGTSYVTSAVPERVNMNATGRWLIRSLVIRVANFQIAVATTFNAVTGSPIYTIEASAERISA